MGSSWGFESSSTQDIRYGNLAETDNLLDLTCSAWIRRASSGQDNAIFGTWIGESKYLFNVDTDNKMKCGVASSSIDFVFSKATTTTISNATWYFLAFTWDYDLWSSGTDNGIRMYVDGALESDNKFNTTVDVGAGINTVAKDFYVGNHSAPSVNDDPFDGLIAYPRMFNRALSLKEIQELMYSPYSISNGLIWGADLINDSDPGVDISGNGLTITSTTGTTSPIGPPVYFPKLGQI